MAGGDNIGEIRVELKTDLPCEISAALRPDDVDLPPGLSIRHLCRDGKYVVEITGVDVLTVKNTVDDVLRCLKVVESLWR